VRGLASALVLAAALWPSAGLAGGGPAEHYLLHCSGCHGVDGRGTPGVTPSLHELAEVFAARGGRSYLARVPGVAQAPVGDAELAALLNWVLAAFSGSPPAEPYREAEVRDLRARPLRDPRAERPSR
jgi:mono/diheme cytochrome c family protein